MKTSASTPWSTIVFKVLCIFTSVLFAYLFFTLLVNSESFLLGLGLQSSSSSFFLARRASVLLLGVSLLLLSSINLSNSSGRRNICFSTGVTMLGLAMTGSYELAKGNINSTILLPIFIEIILGVSFLAVLIVSKDQKSHPAQHGK